MKHRNLGKFLVVAASISMAMSPITALAKGNAPVAFEGETTATVDTKALLNDAIKYAEDAKKEASYANVVEVVKTNLDTKLAKAKEISAKTDANADEIKNAWSALVDAVHYLDFTGVKTELNATIDLHKDKKAEDYKAGWDAFAAALKTAQDVAADNNALQDEIDDAKDALVEAEKGLVAKDPAPVVVDKSKLIDALAEAAALKEAEYTPESWKKLDDAVKAGDAVNKDDKATQDQVDGATNAIKAAIAGLAKAPDTPEVDKTELKKTYDANEALAKEAPEGDAALREETYKPFVAAAEEAKKVLDDENATQDQVDKANDALKAAYANLDQNIYRVYNANNGEHLFTSNPNEYEFLGKNGWKQEGIAWIAPKTDETLGDVMTRMYDKNSGEHHYTKDANEIKALESFGWNNEGPKWASAFKNENVIHRLYNPNENRAGRHHYTLADGEKDGLVKLGWNWENNDSALIYAKAKAEK